MKKFTKVSLVIAAICAGIGVVFCRVGAVMGASFSNVYDMAKEGKFDVGGWHVGEGVYYTDTAGEEGNYDKDVEETFDMGTFESLELQVGAADVTFEENDSSNQTQVMLEYGYKKYFSCEMKGKTLYVKYDTKGKVLNSQASLTVSVPKDAKLQSVTLKTGAGDVDMNNLGTLAQNLTFMTGAGDVEAYGINVTGTFEASTGAGDVTITDGTFEDINLKSGMGDFDFTGTVNGDITVSSGVGETDFELTGKESDYNYELTTGVGEIEIGDEVYSGLGGKRTIENEGAEKNISITTGTGDVSLTFAE